jgi:hypothetical protein
MINKNFKLGLGLYLGVLVDVTGQIRDSIYDTNCICFYQQEVRIVESQRFYPLYLGRRKAEFLGWFHLSEKQILYLSPLHQMSGLNYPKANQVQILFDEHRTSDTLQMYYFGRFNHCQLYEIGCSDGYLFKVNQLGVFPSHGDYLQYLWISNDLKVIKFYIYFMGEKHHLCTFSITQ